MKERKTIRFEDVILKDIDAFAGVHKLKDQDGDFDFSNAIHMRYMELLDAERQFKMVASDLAAWKNYAEAQTKTTKTWCNQLNLEVTPPECAACSEKRIKPSCPKAKPLETQKAKPA